MPDPVNLSTPLAYALAYARLGWHVFPLKPNAKEPLGRLVPRGMLDATTAEETIGRWWRAAPTAGIGIALAPSGLVALDIDPRNGGVETWDALQADHGSLRSEVMAYTGGGGEHHVFLIPPGSQVSLPGTLGPGVDVKANGYIVVEPSVHPSGKQYGWEASSNPLEGVAPSPLPDWLRSLRVEIQRRQPEAGAVPVDAATARDVREALYMLDADSREDWLHAGMALHATQWGHPAYAMWCAWSQQSTKFDSTDQRKTWESFKAPGERGAGLTLAWIFGKAQEAGWVNPKARIAPAPDRGPEPPPYIDEEPAGDELSALPLVFSEDIAFESIKITQIVEDVITAGALSVMYGESNSGKSFIACDMACHLSCGMPWQGKRTVRGAVVYVAGEGAESIKLRVLAWRQHHGMSPYVAIVPAAVNLLDGNADVDKIIRAALAVAEHYGEAVSLIVVDTLARAFGGGNENASEDMGAVITNADRIRGATGAHVMFVHHAGKDSSKGSRGHSSLKAATDTEIEVSGDELTKLHQATITKQRDLGSRGMEITTRFSVVEMGPGQWDKPITTCLVEPSAERLVKSNKEKGNDLLASLIMVLAKQANQTMRKAALVKALSDEGFKSSPIYRAIDNLVERGDATEMAGMVHLNAKKRFSAEQQS